MWRRPYAIMVASVARVFTTTTLRDMHTNTYSVGIIHSRNFFFLLFTLPAWRFRKTRNNKHPFQKTRNKIFPPPPSSEKKINILCMCVWLSRIRTLRQYRNSDFGKKKKTFFNISWKWTDERAHRSFSVSGGPSNWGERGT